jgi:hypothetical protein
MGAKRMLYDLDAPLKVLVELADLLVACRKLAHAEHVRSLLATHWRVQIADPATPLYDISRKLDEVAKLVEAATEADFAAIEGHPMVVEWMRGSGRSFRDMRTVPEMRMPDQSSPAEVEPVRPSARRRGKAKTAA